MKQIGHGEKMNPPLLNEEDEQLRIACYIREMVKKVRWYNGYEKPFIYHCHERERIFCYDYMISYPSPEKAGFDSLVSPDKRHHVCG